MVGAAHAEEYADCLADLGFQRIMLGESADVTDEHKIFRQFVEKLLVVFGEQAIGAERLSRLDHALHDIEFPVNRRKPASGSTKIIPYMPCAMCIATGGTAQW